MSSSPHTDKALHKLIASYTREAGVRRLEQVLGRIIRKVAVRFAEGTTDAVIVKGEDVPELLGPEAILPEQARKELPPGVATGLAWTETGGDVLYIEAALLPSGKELTITGQLGEVMQESAKTARSYLWSHAREFGLDPEKFLNSGLHIHVPAGAIPKDGPSAGVTMTTALASVYSGQPARNDTAMTGEVTLTGLVLPIGGVKEKVLAARRAGLKRVILPRGNQKDLRDLPEEVRSEMEFLFADRVEDVIAEMLPGVVCTPVAPAKGGVNPAHAVRGPKYGVKKGKTPCDRQKNGPRRARGTGITAYLKNKGTLEAAQHVANHESPGTTKLYDRRQDEISLDEVERIAI